MSDLRAAIDNAEELVDHRPPEFSDEALALKFTEHHGADLRYVSSWGKWLMWDGIRWTIDETLKAFNLSRLVCREASAECDDKKSRLANSVASAKTVAAAERLAKADPRHAATTDQWDIDPWLLNTPAGSVNLRTGEVREHSRHDYLTKVTTVGPSDGCPIWMEFLDRVTNCDGDLQGFLQRIVGYALTGSTTEHALFFLYGTGANGKSVFLNTVSGMFGDYHQVTATETLTASRNERHPTELAALRGARLVTASEIEEGRRWAETRIKRLTGGDPITARFMRQDFFEYTPQFKLVIAGNHKPGLRNVDEAIRRRLHLIPFTVTIPPDQRDENLPEKLKAEWPSILQWAIDGCLAWQEIGLSPPEAVRAATEEYLESEDSFAQWFAECCEKDPTSHETAAKLYSSWKGWAERSGEHSMSQKRFSQILQEREFIPKRGTGGRTKYLGLSLIPEDLTEI